MENKLEDLKKQLEIINKNVLDVLGNQKDNVEVIRKKEDFGKYIEACIEKKVIAIDTETDNSTDTMTCKIMGLCLYAPGLKQAYIPINHRNSETKERLEWQLTEKDVEIELKRVVSSKTYVLMHNGKFDFEVLKCTCDVEVEPNWDTMIAAKLLNENESASLKHQYTTKIDKSQDSYKIDKLFENVEYADVDVDIFALYAATDSMMTYKLYEIQVEAFKKEPKILKLFKEIEMPMVRIAAEMEMIGAYADLDYCAKLKEKNVRILGSIDFKIKEELIKLDPVIKKWRLSEAAQENEIVFGKEADLTRIRKSIINKIKESEFSNIGNLVKEKYERDYPFEHEVTGNRYKKGKKKVEILEENIKLSSPKQLGVLFYDVFQAKAVNSFKPTSTGKGELEKLSEQFRQLPKLIEDALVEITSLDDERIEYYRIILRKKESIYDNLTLEEANILRMTFLDRLVLDHSNIVWGCDEQSIKQGYEWFRSCENICELLLRRREVEKLITTYLDVMPKLAKHWPDGKIRFHLNTLGARTGRFSSGGDWRFIENGIPVRISGCNAQGIPAKNHEVRLVYKASPGKVFVGGDFSQQEPKITAFISQDKNMIETYAEGKDIYARIAQSIFNNEYEDNLEFFDKEKTKINLEGKDRRAVGKVIVLATMYGMGPGSVGRKLKISREKAESMLTKFYEEFSNVEKAIEVSKKKCKRQGFIEDVAGRKRRLPNIQLAHYRARFIYKPNMSQIEADALLKSYLDRACAGENGFMDEDDFKLLQVEAKRNNIIIETNRVAIEKAERQCFNSRIQGSAATLTKVTMILLYNDPIIRQCDAHLVFQIHDELILECPEEYAEVVKERLNYIMTNSVNKLGITIPMKCDAVIEERWGEEAMSEELKIRYEEYIKKFKSKNPVEDLCKEFSNFPEDSIRKVIENDNEILKFKWD